MSDMTQVIKESFSQYAAAVLQSRALVDVRDCIKPSARQIFYCLYTDKFLPNKPFKKTLKAIGSAARMYIHGDSSCEGVIMRAGQPFAMRYPLIEVEGNAGNLMMSGNWAAPRYTASRLSNPMVSMFNDIDKDTIIEWRDNYDDTEKYPAVLPTKGYYNIVNGNFGIGSGAASSIPQFNIREVNFALCYLLDNPDCDFEEIYCAPDFATGAILLNEAEVKEALKNGTGSACKLRSVITYDKNERALIASEIPYSVYTNTICEELGGIIENENNPGIERFNDLTGSKPLIKIYLKPKANVNKVIKYLYKNTSLQSYYSINMTMLEGGKYPRVFGWKEALQQHIDHEKIVYRRGFEYDLKKIEKRIHIIDGLLICLASIEEVVQTIKGSSSTSTARTALKSKFLLDDEQTDAVLDMKLSRLAHLEVQKLEDERLKLEEEAGRIKTILTHEEVFNHCLKVGWTETAKKYGDERRTEIRQEESEEDEPTEIKRLQLSLTNQNNFFVNESSSLYTQKRGGVGTKTKMNNGEIIINSINLLSNEKVIFFSDKGNYYTTTVSNCQLDTKMAVEELINSSGEQIINMASFNKKNHKDYIIFITKKGYIKKSGMDEYNTNRQVGIKAITLEEGDKIVSVLFANSEKIAMLTSTGNFLMVDSTQIRPIGRVARGIKGIKLNADDYVVSGRAVYESAKSIISISEAGLIKQTSITEFNCQGTNTKGSKIQKLNTDDKIADFLPINDQIEITIAATSSVIKISTADIPSQTKGTLGVKAIKLKNSNKVKSLS